MATMNERREALARVIQENEDHFDMEFWFRPNQNFHDGGFSLGDERLTLANLETQCGTTACLAGWGKALARKDASGRDVGWWNTEEIAHEYGLDIRVFYVDGWWEVPWPGDDLETVGDHLTEYEYALSGDGRSNGEAEWMTVLDYLRALIVYEPA